jgi:hypothetical protein
MLGKIQALFDDDVERTTCTPAMPLLNQILKGLESLDKAELYKFS